MKNYYKMNIAGLERSLPIVPVNDKLHIAAFIMFGDVPITVACAKELLKKAPDFDIMITAETKGLPLLYEMARQSNAENYILARKSLKVYMPDVISVEVNSITTKNQQKLIITTDDAQQMKGKKVLIVDDVISTGDSIHALETLVEKAGGIVAGKMAVLAEGEAADRKDIIYLERLPLFDKDLNII